jgi:eukaryotic-like serine/threonine-protein kinase
VPLATDGSTLVVPREHVVPVPVGEGPAGEGPPGPPAALPEPQPARRGRAPRRAGRRRTLLAALAALVLVLAAGGVWAVVAGPLARVDVPRVTGATEAGARAQLRSRHLVPEVRRSYDSAVAAGHVVTTRPAAGTSVHEDSAVTVTVSRGPHLYAVPDLVGAGRADAERRVADAHLTVGQVAEQWSETVPAGTVVSQQTPREPALTGGSPVAFTVSRGRQPIPVPSVGGRPQAEAAGAVRDAGLAVGDVTPEASDSVPAGSVVRQSPAGGTLFRGGRVSLVVSSGPPVVPVPNVVNHRLDDAQRQLEAAGLQVSVTRVFGGLLGIVRLQDPAGGQVRKGSTVTLTVV